MVIENIQIGIALLLLTSMLGTAYAEEDLHGLDSSNAAIYKNKQVPHGFVRLSDISFFNTSNEISKSAAEQIIVPDTFSNSVKNLRSNIKLFQPNIPENLGKAISSGRPQYLDKQTTANSIQTIGEVTFSGNVTTLWDKTIVGRVQGSLIVPDLDGDGLNDTLVMILDNDPITDAYEQILKAKKGSNGVTLWSHSISANNKEDAWMNVYPEYDLDGDGLKDVLVYTQKYESATSIYKSSLIAKKGSNGVALWSYSISAKNGGYAWINVYPASDLDGDGLLDILLNTQNYDPDKDLYKSSIIAKNGSDGATLWSYSINGSNAGLSGSQVDDLDGDGLKDVLVNTQNYDSDTDLYESSLIAKKGSNGATLWSDSINGNGAGLFGYQVDDLDGDGLKDVLVNTQNYNTSTGLYTITLIAKNGSIGADLWNRSINGSSVWLSGYPAGDLDGDGLTDVLLNIQKYDSATGMPEYASMAKKGSNGVTLWYKSIKEISGYLSGSPVDDLNGDGLKDVIVNTQNYDPASGLYTYKLLAKNGSNGATLWNHSIRGISAYLSGSQVDDLNGDGLKDVLVNTQNYDPDTGIYTNSVVAKNGPDGSILWSQSINGSSVYLNGYTVDDINGDGLKDVFLSARRYDQAAGMYSSLKAKNGSNGATLWSFSIKGNSTYLYGNTIDDLDGDGLKDVILNGQINDKDIWTYKLKAKKGSNGANLWNESITGKNIWLNAYPSGDLDGDGLKDVLVNAGKYDTTTGIYTNALIARKGKDGTHVWEANANTWMWMGDSYYGNKSTEDLNGDGIDDVLFGTFRKIYAVKTNI
jgi:hypothetical protein